MKKPMEHVIIFILAMCVIFLEGCIGLWNGCKWLLRKCGLWMVVLALGFACMSGCTQPEIRESGKVAGTVADGIIPGSGWLVNALVTGIGGALLGGGAVHTHNKRKQKKAIPDGAPKPLAAVTQITKDA